MSVPLAAKRACASSSIVVLTRALLVLCFALLMSCGGGGGGGGGGGDDPLRVTLDRNSLSWTYLEGENAGGQTVTGTATGTYEGDLFVGAIVENNGAVNAINPNIEILLSGNQATATIFPVANLAAGTYTGRILFLACSDAACNNRIGGTPLPVNFTVTVQAGVRATPAAITRTIESGSGIVEDVVVTPGTNETGFTIGATSAFVQISNQSAGGFRVTLPSLPQGVYTASIPLLGSNGSSATIPVTYTVTEPPGGQRMLSVSPSTVTFTAREGTRSPPETVLVSEASWLPGVRMSPVNYGEGQDWLEITPVDGGFSFVGNATNLSSGTYTAIVTFGNNPLPDGIQEPFGQPVQVFFSLTVGPGLVRPADIERTIDAETLSSTLSGDVDIDVASGAAVNWIALSDVPWLTVTPSGVTGSALSYSIDPAFLSTAENFAEHVANVTVSAPGTVLTPISFAVRVQRRLAEVTGVGAHIQAAGQPTTLVVIGRGFAAVTDPEARLVATDAAPTSVQRVSDIKLLVSFASLSPGEHVVRVNNALGISTAARSAIAVTPTPYPYFAGASGGRVIHLAVDRETDTLYGVRLAFDADSTVEGSLARFRPNGANWIVDSPPIAAVDNVGVLLNGNVIVTTAPGGLTILERGTMNPTFSLDLQCTAHHRRSANMPVTLDGRVWLGQAQGLDCMGFPRHGRLGWFDPATQSFQLFDVPRDPWSAQLYTDGPSFVMSGNGERLNIHQETNQALPAIVYLDASESVLRPQPFDGNIDRFNFGTASSSDDGSRILLDARNVVDDQFVVVGSISIPPYSMPFTDPALPSAAVLSPDGSRAYVLTNPGSYLGQPPPPSPLLPRVWVLDTSGDVGEDPVPVLGYFEIADNPSCLEGVDQGCDYRARAEISLDGQTLFFVGDERFVVTPIPPEGTINQLGGGSGNGQMKPQPWRVSTH